MMKHEWDERVGRELSSEEWEITHEVYQWHPAISDAHGKDDLLKLYNLGGYGLIESMLPDAQAAYTYYQAAGDARIELEALHNTIETAKQKIKDCDNVKSAHASRFKS